MTDELELDARRWAFLNRPVQYLRPVQDLEGATSRLKIAPLRRQFKTAKEILVRLADGRGVLLADDVGLGKTTVGALVAWAVACQDKRVRIYAPNAVLRRRWAEELARHVPMLERLGARRDRIKQGRVDKLKAGRIQITTHHDLIKSRLASCDLMIIDEAHRAKGEGSNFNSVLRTLGHHAKRKLILTATPFSIELKELEQMLRFVGARESAAVRRYARELEKLYELGPGHEAEDQARQLEKAAKEAIKALRKYVIRHSVSDLSKAEKRHFGDMKDWPIPTGSATPDQVSLLLRMDRLLKLAPNKRGERRNDPRFHIGWQYLHRELNRVAERIDDADLVVRRHSKAAQNALKKQQRKPHPKIAAVSEAMRAVLDGHEKVLVFCHHRATACELLRELERSLRLEIPLPTGPPPKVWREAWNQLLGNEGRLVGPIIDWLCTPGLRAQVSSWLGRPERDPKSLSAQLKRKRPRNASRSAPTIFEAARELTRSLLDKQSTSTLALLKNIATGRHAFGRRTSHFPGVMDEGLRTMGCWTHDQPEAPPRTLYTLRPDIVLAIFNSPFGPDVLVTTDHLSEGVDLHRSCRHLIHYELDPSPVRTLQRNGRVRRVGSWASKTKKPICCAYPTFGGTRDEKAVSIMRQRIRAFDVLLGGVPALDTEASERKQQFANDVLRRVSEKLASLNRGLCV